MGMTGNKLVKAVHNADKRLSQLPIGASQSPQ
jgi:hypothetical protein